MAITFDDQVILEGLETVTVASVRDSGNSSTSTATAVRYPMTTREAAASYGAYQLGDVIWTFDTSQVSSIAPLKPRDRITDSDSVVWTIIDCVKSPIASFWKCTARALSIVNDLRQLVDVYRPRATLTQDDAGNREPVFMPYRLQVPCRFQETGRNPATVFGKSMLEISYDVYLSEEIDLDDEDQLRMDGRIYEVTGYQNAERIDELSKATVVWRF